MNSDKKNFSLSEADQRGQFVATLAHDLRTPITAIKINAQLLLRKSENPEAVRAISERICAGVERIDAMVRDLLDAERVRSGKPLPIEPHPVTLDRVLADAQTQWIAAYGPRIELKLGSEPVEGTWDLKMLQRVFHYLLNDALQQAAPQTPIKLEVRKDGASVYIFLHHSVAPARADSAGPLFDIDSKNGAGLAIARAIAQAHGGNLSAEKTADSVQFALHLPLHGAGSDA